MNKTAKDALNAIKYITPKDGVDFKKQLSDAIKQLDQLSSQDQQDVADALEDAFIKESQACSKEDVVDLEKEIKNTAPGSEDEAKFIQMGKYAQGMMMLFQEIDAIKGDQAAPFTKKIVEAYGHLPKEQHADFLSITKLMYQANHPQCDFFTQSKSIAKNSVKGYFAPLTALYKKVSGRIGRKKDKPDTPPQAPHRTPPKP
ncbi:MAG: hypothetical protein ACQEQL_07150 [Pseudomonadota bacterium]